MTSLFKSFTTILSHKLQRKSLQSLRKEIVNIIALMFFSLMSFVKLRMLTIDLSMDKDQMIKRENAAIGRHSLFCQYLSKRLLRRPLKISLITLGALMIVLGIPTFAHNHIAGIQRQEHQFQHHTYVSVELDLDKVQLEQEMINPENGENYSSFNTLKKAHEIQGKSLLFAINSGIYTKEYTPLGLYIENGKQLSPLNRVTSNRGKGNFSLLPNGVFYITDQNRAAVLDTVAFDQRFNNDYSKIRAAVQSGPMLLIEGEYNPYFISDSDSYRIRSGVCVRNQGQSVIFVVTEDKVNFYEFARFFKEQLTCQNALYLDGTLARIYHFGHVYGASFWQAKPLVGIWTVSEHNN